MTQPPDSAEAPRPPDERHTPVEPTDPTAFPTADGTWAAPTDSTTFPTADGTWAAPAVSFSETGSAAAAGSAAEVTPETDSAAQITSAPAPRKRRGPVIASIAFAATLLLCVGAGLTAYLLLRDADRGEGAADPAAAVHGFLEAVYTERDPARAASLTCPEARDDDKIAAKVQEVADQAQTYDTPRFRWVAPRIDDRNPERALVSTTLTLTTGDERSVDQRLGFIVVEENGWWVCDVV